jgi:hypothetical protein
MKKLFYLTFLIPLAFISINSYGQGEFLKKGKTGFGIEADYALSDCTSGFAAGFGISIRGIFDVQFGVGTLSFPEEDFGNDFKALVLSPGITIHVLKQSEKIPISLSVTASYSHSKFSGDMLKDYNLEMTGSDIDAGLGVYRQFRMGSKAAIMPTIDAFYSHTKATVSNNQGQSEDDSDEFVSFIFSLPFVLNLPKEYVLFLTPQIGYGNETTAFGIAIGTVLPFLEANP